MKTAQQVEDELFGGFNELGSGMVAFHGGKSVTAFIVDSWRVITVATHDSGNGMDFWLIWREMGWYPDPQPQYTHFRKVVAWEIDDGLVLHTDQDDEVIRIEALTSPDDVAAWMKSLSYRKNPNWPDEDARIVDWFRTEFVPRWNGNRPTAQ